MSLTVLIAGARGAGLKVLEILERRERSGDESLSLLGFLDDNEDVWETEYYGYPVFGGPDVLPKLRSGQKTGVICSIGSPVNRCRMVERLRALGAVFPNAIHPSASVSRRAVLGEGNILSQNVVVQPGVRIGSFNSFNISAVLGPLCEVTDFCTVNAMVMVASEAKVAPYCYLGMGAKILQRVELAPGTTVGANAFVNRSSEPWSTVVGLPGKTVKVGVDPFGVHV